MVELFLSDSGYKINYRNRQDPIRYYHHAQNIVCLISNRISQLNTTQLTAGILVLYYLPSAIALVISVFVIIPTSLSFESTTGRPLILFPLMINAASIRSA